MISKIGLFSSSHTSWTFKDLYHKSFICTLKNCITYFNCRVRTLKQNHSSDDEQPWWWSSSCRLVKTCREFDVYGNWRSSVAPTWVSALSLKYTVVILVRTRSLVLKTLKVFAALRPWQRLNSVNLLLQHGYINVCVCAYITSVNTGKNGHLLSCSVIWLVFGNSSWLHNESLLADVDLSVVISLRTECSVFPSNIKVPWVTWMSPSDWSTAIVDLVTSSFYTEIAQYRSSEDPSLWRLYYKPAFHNKKSPDK